MTTKTNDIKVALGWGKWKCSDGTIREVRHPALDHNQPFHIRSEAYAKQQHTMTVGLPPYSSIESKPAPATFAECFAVCGALRFKRTRGRGRFEYGIETKLGDFSGEEFKVTDWVYWELHDEGGGKWVSPNGEVES